MSFIVNGVGSVGGITPVLVFESLLPSEGSVLPWYSEKDQIFDNFTAGSLIIILDHTPISADGLFVYYNGQERFINDHWSLNGNEVTILFDDPYVTDYDESPEFHFKYQYLF